MDRPSTIPELASYYQVKESHLYLPCNFCGKRLNYNEKFIFHHHGFKIRWAGTAALASCQRCLRLSGQLEFKKYFQRNILPWEVKEETGTPLWKQRVRCRSCLRLLSGREKRKIQRSREFLYVVRGYLRSYCTLCRLSI